MKINIFLGVFAAIVQNSCGSLTKCFGGECHILCPSYYTYRTFKYIATYLNVRYVNMSTVVEFLEQIEAIGSESKGLSSAFLVRSINS